MINNKKVCIGLAQLSYPFYGTFNKKKTPISIDSFKKILSLAKKEKINFLDTSINYKNVDDRIFSNRINLKDFNVITKINIPINLDEKSEKKIEEDLKQSLKKLGKNCFFGILIHNCLEMKDKKTILRAKSLLDRLQKKKICKYYGLSIYSIKEYQKFKKIINPKIIQTNINYFDREFLYDKKFLNSIKKKNILFFARSIFLQGALLLDKKNLSKKLKKLNGMIIFWEKICYQNNLKKIELAKNFIFNIKYIYRIIVGFQNYQEFKEFIAIRNKKKIIDTYSKKHFKFFYKILKPYKW